MKSKFLFTAALVAMAFTSCQKNEAGQDAPVQQSQDTYIGMTIQLPASAVSRAFQGDDNATQAESKLTSVTVGTWSPGAPEVTYTEVQISDLTHTVDGIYTAKTAVPAKTGTCNVIVLANTAAKPTMAQINGTAFDATVADIATADKFVMYSDAVKVMTGVVLASEADIQAGTVPTNKTSVTLRRAAVKVAVKSSLTVTGGGVADGQGNGLLTDIKWNIANDNSQMTTIANLINPNDGFVASNVKSPYTRLATDKDTELKALSGESVVYCLENARGNEVYRENNTTAVRVSAVFTPGAGKYVATVTGNNAADAVITLGTAPMNTGLTFYVSKVKVGTQLVGAFFAEAAVDGAVAAFGVSKADDFTKYTDGKCFWAVWINDGASNYGVLRNHMYTMNIKGIRAPGFPIFPDTDKPIALDTWIMVDMNVEKWNAKGMGDIEL